MEMMIVVVIGGILASLATAYFGDNIKKSRCTEGRSAVLSRTVLLEKCKATYSVYNNAACNIATGATPEGSFDITLARDATTYTLTATATGSNAPNSFCSTITINQLAVQGGTGSSPW